MKITWEKYGGYPETCKVHAVTSERIGIGNRPYNWLHLKGEVGEYNRWLHFMSQEFWRRFKPIRGKYEWIFTELVGGELYSNGPGRVRCTEHEWIKRCQRGYLPNQWFLDMQKPDLICRICGVYGRSPDNQRKTPTRHARVTNSLRGRAKLTDQQVREIRQFHDEYGHVRGTTLYLSKKYGVSRPVIDKIAQRSTYRWVDEAPGLSGPAHVFTENRFWYWTDDSQTEEDYVVERSHRARNKCSHEWRLRSFSESSTKTYWGIVCKLCGNKKQGVSLEGVKNGK